MLIHAIVAEFTQYFQGDSQHDTILWFDPHREWAGLLPDLNAHLPLLVYEGSQLSLRYQLVKRAPGQRYVVYLPFKRLGSAVQPGGAETLRPFLYTSRLFDESIESFLRAHGVVLSEAAEVMRGLRPLLPALAVASVGKGKAFWTGIVNLETALARLIPDFEDLLLRFLAAPERVLAELRAAGLAAPFLSLVQQQFDAAPPAPGDEEAWADRFTATLCLVDVHVAAAKPAQFPFESALPAPVHWDRCRGFLQKWQRDEMFREVFARRAQAIDAQYSLAAWVRALPEPPARGAFLNVEQAVWERVVRDLDRVADKAGAVAFCRAQRDAIRRHAQGFWAREGAVAGWRALERMAEVVVGADEALAELQGDRPPMQALIGRYTETWWQVDKSYRRFRAELDQGVSGLDSALKWTQRLYQEFLETANARLGEALTREGRWPPAGMALAPVGLWIGAAAGSGRRAIILADALRYELGQELTERLGSGPRAEIEAALSQLPSVTALGMAALLPGWPDFSVDYRDGWQITAPAFDGNLATRAGRLGWLERRLPGMAAFDLDTWLSTPLAAVPGNARWLVISSAEIDALGEGAASVAWRSFDGLLDRLEQAVRRLVAVGCVEIHVVADHGFLLRDTVRDSDKIAVSVDGILKKAERYLVGRDLPPADLPSAPVPNSDRLVAWFPRGTGCFVTPGPYNYMHGGLSLQEVVTAHLVVRQTSAERPVGVGLELVTGPEIRNAIFKVRLLPRGVDLWTKSRQVTVDVARAGERVSRTWDTTVDRDVVETSLRLEPGSGLSVGDEITVRVWDSVTGELLAQQPATVRVSLDW